MQPNRLILTVGLPRSGKTTWARNYADQSNNRVAIANPDAIRLAHQNNVFIAETEPFIWVVTRIMARSWFLYGYEEVILDATNTTRERRDWWRDGNWEVAFKVCDTPAEECRRRAVSSGRDDLLPIIDRMQATFEPVSAAEGVLLL
jgi:predicted kinase